MSDDDDVILVKKPKQVYYGSLEEQEKARLAALAAAAKEGVEDSGGKELGDIQVSGEYMELEEEMSRDKKALLEEFERRRKARQLNVSTDDDEVRRSLRQLGEPVCLFGEGPAERRVRLRDLLSYLGEDAIHKKLEEEEARIERDRGREGTWYHEGPPQLKDARLFIARYSLPRAKRSETCDIVLFADDTSLIFKTVRGRDNSDDVSRAMSHVSHWFTVNNLLLNAKKN
ncbi:jg5368 [Pararge aegeria aegeria]|uniref:Jg5368 protein n=1 Tax=Pararge aegeria aegeria TaxID=348720 RepID=A0A8S4QVD9_9NEOP|nr:jg5368 [Pararge aegeria aegeria]